MVSIVVCISDFSVSSEQICAKSIFMSSGFAHKYLTNLGIPPESSYTF